MATTPTTRGKISAPKADKPSRSKRATPRDFAKIRMLVCDVDGVMTDGGVYYQESGRPSLRFSIIDGLGIVLLQRAGVQVAVLTSGDNPVIGARMKRLGVAHYRTGVMKKGEALRELLAELRIPGVNVAYMADDVNDAAALKLVGLPIAVANARPQILALARYKTTASGGSGAVREVCDRLIAAKGLDPVTLWDAGGGAS